MRKKFVISMAVVALLLMGVMATSVLASDLTVAKNTAVPEKLQATTASAAPEKPVQLREFIAASVKPYDSVAPVPAEDTPTVVPDEASNVQEVDVDALRETVPDSYDETDARVSPQRTRFLLYTHDGKHVMWGFVGNGYFVGTDNHGNRCWGIYGKGVFAGFYDGEFFWGNYRCGNWKAEGLFGLNHAHGKYILFPTPDITPATTTVEP